MNIFVLHSSLYFFVWNPETNKFICAGEQDLPSFEIDMLEITRKIKEDKVPEAHMMLGRVKKFIANLPGEATGGAAIIEGPLSLAESGVKYTAWKLKYGKDNSSPLNKILTELGINVSKD